MDKLKLARDGAVAIVALADPATLNALTPGDCTRLVEALDGLAEDEGVGAIVLTGEGRAFCSGANMLAAAAEIPRGGGAPDLQDVVARFYNPVAERLAELPVPTVAAVNGMAAGIGAAYALGCDLVVAAESAAFSFAFRRVGLVPDGGATWLLPRLVGRARAMELALLGETLPASRALAWGLVNRCVPDAGLMETALGLAHDLAQGPASLGPTAALLRRSSQASWREQLAAEAAAQGAAGRSRDFQEGVTAFIEKRTPRFEGR